MTSVKLSEFAQKQVKELRKRYFSIPDDVLKLIDEIEINPKTGSILAETSTKRGLQLIVKQKAKVVPVGLFIFFIRLIQIQKLLL